MIKHGVSKNTLAAYGRALTKWDTWLSTAVNPRELTDAVLAEYITHLHESGKSPATISKLVGQSPLDYWLAFVGKVETAVAVKWTA